MKPRPDINLIQHNACLQSINNNKNEQRQPMDRMNSTIQFSQAFRMEEGMLGRCAQNNLT
jgi:hypothetical protein